MSSGIGAVTGRVPQHARRTVCRNLFGPVDREEINRGIEEKLREFSESDQKRWNFDFVSDKPLVGGDHEWETTLTEATPVFYQETVHVGKGRKVAECLKPRTEAPDWENCGRLQGDAVRGAASSARRRPPNCSKRRKTTLITDFYVKRRTQRNGKRTEGVLRNPHSLSSEPVTRKPLR